MFNGQLAVTWLLNAIITMAMRLYLLFLVHINGIFMSFLNTSLLNLSPIYLIIVYILFLWIEIW